MDIYECLYGLYEFSMGMYRVLCVPVGSYGFLWVCMGPYEFPCGFVGLYGSL